MSDPTSRVSASNLRTHFFYVTIFLISIIILLATEKWTDIKGFTEYLTAAGTMVSIVLGVLAIIYSFVSNDSIAQSLGGVTSTLGEIQNAKVAVQLAAASTVEVAQSNIQNNKELHSVIAAIRAEVVQLNEASTHLQNNTRDIADVVQKMPPRFDVMEAMIDSVLAIPRNFPPQQIDDAQRKSLAQSMLKHASVAGFQLYYALAWSWENKKSLNLNVIPIAKEEIGRYYMLGYLVATAGSRVLTYRADKDLGDPTTLITVDSCMFSSAEVDAARLVKPATDGDNPATWNAMHTELIAALKTL